MMSNDNQLMLASGGQRKWFQRRGLPEKLDRYFYWEDRVCDFAISGQGADLSLLYNMLYREAGEQPIIIVHSNKASAKAEAALVWTNKFGSLNEGGTIWSGDEGGFEPLLGMEEMDIVRVLHRLAEVLGMNCTPRFDKVVSAHLKILKAMGCAYCLSGLHYLCGFEDLREFQGNIMKLDCTESERNLILANLGLNNPQYAEQFDLFRMLVRQLAHEARSSGWKNDGETGSMNLTTAIAEGAMLLLNVSGSRAPLVLAYLREELRLNAHREFLLIIDEVCLKDTGIVPILSEAGNGFRLGLLGSNILKLIDSEKETAQSFCGGLNLLILLKHRVAPDAEKLVELLGTH